MTIPKCNTCGQPNPEIDDPGLKAQLDKAGFPYKTTCPMCVMIPIALKLAALGTIEEPEEVTSSDSSEELNAVIDQPRRTNIDYH